MGRREKAREAEQFHRGDIGVDGQATEEVKDVAEVERDKAREQLLRGKAYLGREFLTWLLWRSESGEALLSYEGEALTVLFIDRLVLRGIAGDIVETMVKGAMSPYSPLVRRSLDRGLLIHTARLRLTHGEQVYVISIDAEHLDLKSGKLPEKLDEGEESQLEERLYFAERLSNLVHALLEEFLKLRVNGRWLKSVVPAMKEWMAEAAAEPAKRRATG
jgi:hypothetical protein